MSEPSMEEDEVVDLPIVRDFDKLCFEFGDRDSIVVHGKDNSPVTVSYFELQEHSKALANQLYYRFGWPDYVLVDCQESPAAEAVATLSCMRIFRPFVPVSSLDQQPGQMQKVLNLLSTKGKNYYSQHQDLIQKAPSNDRNDSHYYYPSIVAVVVCENDRDPLLSVFQQAGVHRILYLDPNGGMREALQVPDTIHWNATQKASCRKEDDLYVLMTSGTTSKTLESSAKAVVGSHRATHARLRWFLDTFSSSPRIGRRTKLTFVDGVTELWGALLDWKSVLVAVPPSQLRDKGVKALVEDAKCTQLLLLPSQLNQLLLASTSLKTTKSSLGHLERVIVSGEVCSALLWEQFRTKYPSIQFINMYGQTETTGDCLCAVLTDLGDDAVFNNVVAVGKPISDDIRISASAIGEVDGSESPEYQQQPLHQQLLIQGSQLSNGYLGSPLAFKEFCPGDVGFHRNGIWYVSGRIGDVCKINGVRTSLAEIECAFCKTYDVGDSAAVVAVMVKDRAIILCNNKDAVNEFSRSHMHNTKGIALNLIPTRVLFVPKIPRRITGAQKIDRKACKRLVENYAQRNGSHDSIDAPERESKTNVICIVATVLGVNERDIDRSKSFLELGGDSASSITLLYRLRQELDAISDVTATDILWCESLDELEQLVLGKVHKLKRRRREIGSSLSGSSLGSKTFIPKPLLKLHSKHRSISFLACVDSTPVVIGNSILSACHGGVIMKFHGIDGAVEGHRHYPGWMFQADLVLIDGSNTVLVCGYSLSNKGILICLTCDLAQEKWRVEFHDPVKSRPNVSEEEVWLLSGDRLVGIDLRNGQMLGKELQLPRTPCISNPIAIFSEEGQRTVAFASSDWEGGMILVDIQTMESKIHIDNEIGPVHKHVCATKNSREIIISDIYGSLHVWNTDSMQISACIQLSCTPLSTATKIDENTIVVGSYSGVLYCIAYDKQKGQLEKRWECDCYSSIYSKPLNMHNDSIVVCTTAGSVLEISIANGKIQSFHRINAEIWSSPVQLGQQNYIAVGARDSRCHIVAV